MTDTPEWKPFSEMPSDMTGAFLHKHTMPTWVIAHKDSKGVWRAVFGMIQPEIIEPETYWFLPLTIIPPLPTVSS